MTKVEQLVKIVLEIRRQSNKARCKNEHMDEEALYKVFVNRLNALVENKEHFIDK